jgi:hypothetical protein
LLVHPTHVPVAASQVNAAPPQRPAFVAEHWPQAPLGWHAGFAGPHCASAVQPRHVCVVASQTGLLPEQSALEAQPTHVPLAASHAAVAPPQAPVRDAEHWPQAPLGSQAGAVPPQSGSPAQGTQVCVTRSHVGRVPPHSAFEAQATQRPVATSHAGRAPVHFAAFVIEHWPQAPEGSQAGAAAVHSLSAAQPRQVSVVRLQMGVVPPHCPLLVHATQVPVARSHADAVPVHRLKFVDEH